MILFTMILYMIVFTQKSQSVAYIKMNKQKSVAIATYMEINKLIKSELAIYLL